jgi:cell envelope opacity-associated protein A
MNLSAIRKCWLSENQKNEKPKRQIMQPYTKENIKNFLDDVKSGKKKAKAGRDNGIPNGSVYHLSRVAGL